MAHEGFCCRRIQKRMITHLELCWIGRVIVLPFLLALGLAARLDSTIHATLLGSAASYGECTQT